MISYLTTTKIHNMVTLNNKSSIHLRYDLDFKSWFAFNNLHLLQKIAPMCVFKTIIDLKEL